MIRLKKYSRGFSNYIKRHSFSFFSLCIVLFIGFLIGFNIGHLEAYEEGWWAGEAAGYRHGSFWAYDEANYLREVTLSNLSKNEANGVNFYKSDGTRIKVFTIIEKTISLEESQSDFTYSLILSPNYVDNILLIGGLGTINRFWSVNNEAYIIPM